MQKKKNKTTKNIKGVKQEKETLQDNLDQEVVDKEEVTSDSLDEQKNELEELKLQLNEQKDKFLRLFAEFENYKKRTLKERIDLISTAAQDTMAALLPVLDDFDRAKKNAESEGGTEVFSDGITLIYNKLNSILKDRGLEAMGTDGEIFDPELHDALTEIPAPTKKLKGKVVDTIEKGYFLKGKIIRHAKVVVGK